MTTYLLTYDAHGERHVAAYSSDADRLAALTAVMTSFPKPAGAMDALTRDNVHDVWERVRPDDLDGLWLDDIEVAKDSRLDAVEQALATKTIHLEMPDYEMRRLMVLSTAHVSEKTAKWLDSHSPLTEWPMTGGTYGQFDGWFFYCAEANNGDEGRRIPDDLFAVMQYARMVGCDNVLLDNDGPRVDALPQWEW